MNLIERVEYLLLNIKVNFIYFLFVFDSIFHDISRRIWKLKPVPYVERRDYVAVVTGGGRGLGAFVVKKLLDCGMTVVVGVRDPNKCKQLLQDVSELSGKIDLMELDVSNMKSVTKFSKLVNEKYPKINLLVNNAGILDRDKEETDEGFDPILATNYLGHFLLTHLLLKNLEEAGKNGDVKSRIVNVASCAHAVFSLDLNDINMKKNYVKFGSYARSKLAQLMFSRYLDGQLKSHNIPVMSIAIHPGVVATNMVDNRDSFIIRNLLLTEEQGARHVLFGCFEESSKGGEYYYNDSEGYSTSESQDKIKQNKLFDMTCDMLNIKSYFM